MYILNRNEEIVAILSGNADDSGCHFFNSTLTLEINKGASLVFEVDTAESDIVQHIKEENMVVVNDGETFRLLIIKEVSDIHDSDYIKEVYCEDASIELIDEVITEEVSGKVEMGIVLADLLEGTRWSIGEVDNTYIRNVNPEFKLKSVLNGIQSLAKQYDAEIDFTVEFAGNRIVKRKVNMKKSFGRALGKRFEFGKDVTSIKRTVNTSDIKTAIIPFGKPNEETGEALTIQGISWATPTNPMNKPLGQIYLEDAEATALWGYKGIDSNKRPRWVAITFEECEDANELLSLAHLQLNRFNKPKISYEANVIDLFRMTGDDSYSFEKVGLGDLVNIIDHNFAPALALSSRVVKLELDLNDTSNSVVTLGTIVESIVDKDLKTQIEELNVKVGAVASNVDLSDIEDRLDSLESETGTGQWEQIQEVNNLLFGNGVGYHYMSEDNGIWVFDKPANQNPTKAVALKGGMIGLAKYDSQKQVWNVGTFIDGNSVNASMINTGTLKADRIEAGSLTVKHFNQELKSIINSVGDKPSREEVTTSIQTAVDNITLSVKSTYATKSETESAKTSAITESKKYSDIKKGEAISEAVQSSNSYADEKKAEAVTDANEYSDAKKDEAVAEAGKDAQAKADAVKTILTKQIELKAEKTDVYTKSQTYSKSETDSKIQVAKESIELSVSGTYETKSNVENKVSTAKSEAILSAVSTSKSYADTKKAEAITQAGKDADSKVATAKTELNGKIDLKASKTDVYTKTETYTKAQTDSAIKIAKDEINLGVKNTYETKSNVENKISTAVNNVQVGGTNFATDTNKGVTGWNWSLQTGGKAITEVTENGIRCCKIVRDTVASTGWSYISYNRIGRNKYLPSRKYTVSFEVKSSVPTTFYCAFTEGNGLNRMDTTNTKATVSEANKWTKLNFTVTMKDTLPSSTSQVLYLNGMDSGTGVTYIFRNLIITEGTKASSWSPAPEDINSAIDKKANSTDVYTKTETYTKAQTDSAIKVAKDEINLGVKNTYETKTNVESKVNNAVNNIQVGGRNLILNSALNGNKNWTGTVTIDTSKKYENCNSLKYTGTASSYSSSTPAKVGDVFTISLKSFVGTSGGNLPLIIFEEYKDNTTTRINYQETTVSSTLNSWQPYTKTWTVKNSETTNVRIRIYNRTASYNFWVSQPKLERGTKATDWTPAPEDVDSAIGTKANSNDVYKKTEVYTKAETNSQINVAKDSITNTVSQSYLSKSDATNTYATKSSLTQTANNITAKFEASGGYNLLQNSGFKTGDISRWWIHQHNSPTGSYGVLNSSATWGFPDSSVNCCQIKMTNQSGKEYGIAQNVSTTTGKKYTISLYYAGHRVSSANIIVRNSDGKWVANKSFNPSAKTGGNSNISNWGSISLTFTATQPSHTINLVLNSAENDGYFWIAKPQIVEGEVALPYSPHPHEIYTGSTVIDASGVTINNGAIKVKNNAGTTVLEGDSAGNLTLNGTIRSESSSGRHVSLNSGGVTFKDSRKSEEVLRMATSYHTNRDINGVTVALPQYGDFLGFKHIAKPSLENGWNSSDTTYNFMDLWSTDYNDSGGFKFYKGINVFAPTYYNQRIRFRNGSSQYLHEITPNITWNSLGGLMGIYGDNGAVLGYKSGDNLNARIVVTEENHPGTADVIKSWGHWNCSGYIVHNATFRGNHENSYSNSVARAYSKTSGIEAEEKQVRFNFENVQIKEGRAVLSVPKRYAGINNGYVVSSIVKKGKGDVWVAEEQENRFTIEADADIKVNVEIIIKMSEVASYSVRTTPENARCFDTSTGQLIEK